MAKPLNQKEIDALLLGQSAGTAVEPDEETIRPYNFKRPRLFAQDQMRALSHVHETFARDIAVYLSAQFRTTVDVTLSAIDQVLYAEFVQSSAPPSALYIVQAKEFGHKVVLELDPRLVVFTVERLLGGPGGFPTYAREVTHIEQRIMGKVVGRLLDKLTVGWTPMQEVHFEEVAFESNAEFVQVIPGVESALVATFAMQLYDEVTTLNICYPYALLEGLLGRTGMKQWISSTTSEVPAPVRRQFEDRMRAVTVELRAELGRTKLTLAELTQLQVGDVVPLERRLEQPIQVFVGDQPRFQAAPGRSGKRRALCITSVTEPINREDYDRA